MEQYYNSANLHDDYIADQNKHILKIIVGVALVAGVITVIYFLSKDNKAKNDNEKDKS